MNFKTFIKKFNTDFSFRKKTIIGTAATLLAVCGIVIIIKSDGLNLLANVSMSVRPATNINTHKCSDSDGGKDYFTKGLTKGLSITTQTYTENNDYCSFPMLIENYCDANKFVQEESIECTMGCNDGACRNCDNPAGILACSLGLDTCDALCMLGTGTSGYGYGRGGQGTGYGYGYGFKKIDPNTRQPYLYLVDVFATYSKKIYNKAVDTIGFQMVKFYNKKEFTAPLRK